MMSLANYMEEASLTEPKGCEIEEGTDMSGDQYFKREFRYSELGSMLSGKCATWVSR